jgi:transcription-repair coupling factor (superfamily II helicase)
VKNKPQIFELFRDHPVFKQLKEHLGPLNDNREKWNIRGLLGSSVAFFLLSVFKNTKLNHVFIAEDKDAAAYLQNDLKNLFDKKTIFYFPDSFKRPGHFDQLNTSNILLRTDTVNRFLKTGTRAEIMITYPEAVFEKVISKKVLDENTLHISIDEKLDIDFIIELLVTYSFERVDFVYEPGQFSIRGGIIDIFSFGNDFPYRIELFDDEVESIRTFDPSTQLSQKKIRRITIIPNIQTHLSSSDKVGLFDVLPSSTLIWTADTQLCYETLAGLQVKAAELIKQAAGNEDVNHPFKIDGEALPYLTAEKWIRDIELYSVIELNKKTFFEPHRHYQFNISIQTVFNKNFNLLIEKLKENTEKGFSNYLFSANAKQLERFYQIFEDLEAEVEYTPVLSEIHCGFIDRDLKVACYTDHQIFNRYHKYHIKQAFSKSMAISLKTLRELTPGDYVTHIDHGVGRFSGLEKIEVNGNMQEAVRIVYKDNDLLYVNISTLHKISKYSGAEGKPPKINKLGSDAWATLKRKAKRKVKDIAKELIELYAKRKAQTGYAFSPDSYLQTELEASFIYEDTPDQFKATQDVKNDMTQSNPMDRLICGDVGFGKTEIAVRAAFKAVADSKQVAVLVPTTILAMQHFRTFKERLGEFPCNIDYISRFKSAAQKKKTIESLKNGKIDIIIGTHSLIGNAVGFKDLGLMIIDEEQKFGVAAKEKLKQKKLNVDTLTLTATPIPRTLKFSLMGARDLSIINTPPPNRQPINTELHIFNDEVLKDAINYEFYRGGQVFFIHNRVKDIEEMAGMIKKLCPDVEVGIAHGQMEGKELERRMMKFIQQEYDILVSTNIIESGLDIPNANTIIINNAHWFGLSDLHQLRGRVGRSNKKAFCYLFSPPLSSLTQDARKRLKTIERFAELGSGFNIAMQDLDIRGAGNMLGGEQSGFVAEIGFDMYHKILDEAILELKETEFKDLFKKQLTEKEYFIEDVQLDTDIEMMLPDRYVSNINERLSIYTQLNNVKDEEALNLFREQLIDRFGPVPGATEELLNAMRIQWAARKLGFERVLFKNKTLKCFFISNENSSYYDSPVFGKIMSYIQGHSGKCKVKQTNKHLIVVFENVLSMNHANHLLNQILDSINDTPDN